MASWSHTDQSIADPRIDNILRIEEFFLSQENNIIYVQLSDNLQGQALFKRVKQLFNLLNY